MKGNKVVNRQKLPDYIVSALNETPLDEKSLMPDTIDYQTKIGIYDAKCSGCGFAKIDVIDEFYGKTTVLFSTNIIAAAINFAQENYSCRIVRQCDYPNNNEILPLNVIIMNTCMLWHEEKIEQFETEFIEIECEDLLSREVVFPQTTIELGSEERVLS